MQETEWPPKGVAAHGHLIFGLSVVCQLQDCRIHVGKQSQRSALSAVLRKRSGRPTAKSSADRLILAAS